MMNFVQNLNPIVNALIAGLFTLGMTTLGAATIFLTKKINQKIFDSMLGFAGGIMIAASFWSLLSPAIAASQDNAIGQWFPSATGFLMGAIFLRLIDRVLPHLHIGSPVQEAEGIKTSWQRSILLVSAITLHNIPEGLAVGVAFGAVASEIPLATLPAAISLAVGMGIHNFIEGFAVSVPLRREGLTRLKSFFYGMLSAIVEPIAAVIGASAVFFVRPLLPYALSFAAGAMMFVVVEEVIPESQRNGNTDLATTGAILGIMTMMILAVIFS